MSLNRGLEQNGIIPTYVPTLESPLFVPADKPWLLTIASLELKIIALEAKVEELEILANTQQQLNQKLLDIVAKLTQQRV